MAKQMISTKVITPGSCSATCLLFIIIVVVYIEEELICINTFILDIISAQCIEKNELLKKNEC